MALSSREQVISMVTMIPDVLQAWPSPAESRWSPRARWCLLYYLHGSLQQGAGDLHGHDGACCNVSLDELAILTAGAATLSSQQVTSRQVHVSKLLKYLDMKLQMFVQCSFFISITKKLLV